jgi:serine/tyrosine/threonine adenylyltransferase
LFGIDPEEARKEVEASLNPVKIDGKDEEGLKAKNAQIWEEWLHAYRDALNKAPVTVTDDIRRKSMNSVNPKFILRNYLLEEAIKAAEGDDFSKVNDLLKNCFNPYDDASISEVKTRPPPKWAYDLCVSCSS